MSWTPLDTLIVIAYLVGALWLGVWASRRIGSVEDFYLAGRNLGAPLLIGGLVATYYGLDVTFGSSETAFYEGVSTFFVYSAPFYVAYAIVALVLAPKIRGLNVMSLPEAAGSFYGRPTRLCVAAASLLYSLPILSVFGIGVIGQWLFGWDPIVGAVIGGSIACVYTILGGLLADSITDTAQFALMMLTVGLAGLFAFAEYGGIEAMRATMPAEFFRPTGGLSSADIMVYGMIALTPLIEPAFYQRILAARNPRAIQVAFLIGIALWIAFDWIVVYLGMLGRTLVETGVLSADLDPSAIIAHTAGILLPTGLIGLFAAGLVATAMSSTDSYALLASSSAIRDGWSVVTNRELSPARLLLATRVGIAIAIGLALALAIRFDRIRDAWIFMASILVNTALIPMLVALIKPKFAHPLAGTLSSGLGLAASIILFALFEGLGTYDPDRESRGFAVANFTIYREHATLIALPISGIGFIMGSILSKKKNV